MRRKQKQNQEFKRATVTIPVSLVPFAETQKARPEHANNFSSYVRSLIIRDQERRQREAVAA